MEYCPIGGIEADILGKAEFVDTDKCIGCKRCVWYCPDFANWVEEINDDDQGGANGNGVKEVDTESAEADIPGNGKE